MHEELWTEVCNIVQEVVKIIPKKKKYKSAKYFFEEALQIAEKRGEATGEGEKERYIHLNEVQFSSVSQSCPTLCDPVDCSTPGLSVQY